MDLLAVIVLLVLKCCSTLSTEGRLNIIYLKIKIIYITLYLRLKGCLFITSGSGFRNSA